MSAPLNNQFWKLRSKHGRDKIFASPEVLWEEATTYFKYIDEHPSYKNEGIKAGERAGEYVRIPTEKPYTLKGLCIFLGVNDKYFNDFEDSLRGKEDKESKDFSEIITRIKDIIYVQKYNGAVIGNFNSKIIAVELSINETINVNNTGTKETININIDGKKVDLT